jgi:predicted dehydrogenase
MIRVAVVGYGFSSTTFHLPFIQADPQFSLQYIVSSKVDSVKLDHADVAAVSQLSDIPVDKVDLVVITTPNQLHFEQVRDCLNAGWHVVVEKPFVLSREQAVTLADLAEQLGRLLVVFQNRRWDGDFLTLRSMIDTGGVGQVKKFVSRFDRFRPNVRVRWREQAGPGAGILWDLGPHLVDQMVALFGKPSAVTASVMTLRDSADVDDNFEIWFEYPGFQVMLGSSSFQAGPIARFQLEGSEGTFIKYGLDVQEDALRRGEDVSDERWGQETEDSWGILYSETKNKLLVTKPGNYGAFWHQVYLCLAEGAKSPVPLSESILVIELIELAFKSSQEKRTITIS